MQFQSWRRIADRQRNLDRQTIIHTVVSPDESQKKDCFGVTRSFSQCRKSVGTQDSWDSPKKVCPREARAEQCAAALEHDIAGRAGCRSMAAER